MKPWKNTSRTCVSSMADGDFFSSEQSHIMSKVRRLSMKWFLCLNGILFRFFLIEWYLNRIFKFMYPKDYFSITIINQTFLKCTAHSIQKLCMINYHESLIFMFDVTLFTYKTFRLATWKLPFTRLMAPPRYWRNPWCCSRERSLMPQSLASRPSTSSSRRRSRTALTKVFLKISWIKTQ